MIYGITWETINVIVLLFLSITLFIIMGTKYRALKEKYKKIYLNHTMIVSAIYSFHPRVWKKYYKLIKNFPEFEIILKHGKPYKLKLTPDYYPPGMSLNSLAIGVRHYGYRLETQKEEK